jgi:hypothetical protein
MNVRRNFSTPSAKRSVTMVSLCSLFGVMCLFWF